MPEQEPLAPLKDRVEEVVKRIMELRAQIEAQRTTPSRHSTVPRYPPPSSLPRR